MGARGSKPFIPINVAKERFSEEEWQRFSEGFDKIANSKGLLSRKGFAEAVLGSHMPPELCERLFEAMSGKLPPKVERRYNHRTGRVKKLMKHQPAPPLSKDAFLAGMAVILKGTEDEKLRLLFNLMDSNMSKSLSKEEMYEMICLLEDTELSEQIAQVGSRSVLADRLLTEAAFQGKKKNSGNGDADRDRRDRAKREITFAEFREWAKETMTPGLVTWIFNIKPDTGVDVMPESMPVLKRGRTSDGKPSIWENKRGRGISIAEATHFDEKEVGELQNQYNKLLADSTGRVVSRARLRDLFLDTPDELFERIFAAFDSNKDGVVDLNEFIVGMSSCCRGSLPEKLRFCFNIFDADRDGRLSEEELVSMVKSLGAMEGLRRKLSAPKSPVEEKVGGTRDSAVAAAGAADAAGRLPGTVNNAGNGSSSSLADFKLPEEVTILIKGLVKSAEDEKVTVQEFLKSSLQSHLALGFFSKISQIASLRLGIRPRDAAEEAKVVLTLVGECDEEKWKAGESVFIISHKWAQKWSGYTGIPLRFIHMLPDGQPPVQQQQQQQQKEEEKPGETKSNRAALGDEKMRREAAVGGGGGPPPAEIDNSFVLAESSHTDLRRGLKVGADFIVVRPRIWSALGKWYGGGPLIQRRVIATRADLTKDDERLTVEFYPWVLDCHTIDNKISTKCEFSRSGTLDKFKLKVCSLLQLNPQNTRLWSYYQSPQEGGDEKAAASKAVVAMDPELLESTMSLENAQLVDGQKILIERRIGGEDGKKAGKWEGIPGQDNSKKKKKKDQINSGFDRQVGGYKTGCVGLFNLGNTCFMNAALQCLSNTVPLTQYFLQELYAREINRENKLGMGGRVASYYGRHIKEMWRASFPVFPRGVKLVMARKNPQFEGYQQQDSQELLMSLLDGLHEDLCRVKEKPYVQIPDSNGRSDQEVAREHIECYLKRDRSVIVDLFSGVIKSQIRWPDAPAADNRKFEAFNMLSLPVPEESDIRVSLKVMFQNPDRAPLKVSLNLKHNATLMAVKEAIAEMKEVAIPPKRLALCDVTNSYVFQFLSQTLPLRKLERVDIVAYEVPVFGAGEGEEKKADKSDMTIKMGKWFDVKDRLGGWYRGVVIAMDVEKRLVKIHFEGFSANEDEVISVDDDRFRPLDTVARNRRIVIRDELLIPKKNVQVICLHRRMVPNQANFFNPNKPELFGLPFVLFIPSDITGAALYELVWEKTRRFTTPPPLMKRQRSFFEALEQDGDAKKDKDGKQGEGNEKKEDDQAAGHSQEDDSPFPPFVLKFTNKSGKRSSKESWNKFSFGSPVEFNRTKLSLDDETTISIDWNKNFLQKYLNMEELLSVSDHSSVGEIARLPEPKVDIKMCFKLFTETEKLNDEIYCSAVKKHLKAEKKIELFSAPPILVVHLKRLLPRYKIQTYVDTPLSGFNITPYLTKSASEDISIQNISNALDQSAEGKTKGGGGQEAKGGEKPQQQARGQKSSEKLYDLYAVINHYGSAYGGHYVAYAKSKKGGVSGWFCFDDSRVTKIKESEVVTRHAYMLFYKRRDFDGLNFLPPSLKPLVGKPLTAQERRVLEEAAKADSNCGEISCGGKMIKCSIS